MRVLRLSAVCLGVSAAFNAQAGLGELEEEALRKAIEIERIDAQSIQLVWHHLDAAQLAANEIGDVVATVISEIENQAPDLPSLGASTMWLNGEAVTVDTRSNAIATSAAAPATADTPQFSNISVEPPAPPASFAADAEADYDPPNPPNRFYWDAYVVRGKPTIQLAQANVPIEMPVQKPVPEDEGLLRGKTPTPTASEITSPPIQAAPPAEAVPSVVDRPSQTPAVVAQREEEPFDIRGAETPREEPEPIFFSPALPGEEIETVALADNLIPMDIKNPTGKPSWDPDALTPGPSAIPDFVSPPLDGVPAVPEPSTYAFMAAGLGLMGFYLRKKRAKSVSKDSALTRLAPD